MNNSRAKEAIGWMLFIGLIWFVAKLLSHQSPEWDNMEELVWANSFELGYQKHPPLPTWILYPATLIFGKSLALSFGLGLLCVFAANVCIYYLFSDVIERSRGAIPSYAAFMAVLVSSPIAYYTIRGTDFNHNAAQLWSLAAMLLFYYRAWVAELEGRFSLQNWALVGFFGGLALLTKYSAVIQIATLATHFLWARRWNNSKAWVGLLLSAGIATLLFLPHLMWVLDQAANGMGPLKYAQTSVEGAGNFLEQLDQLIIGFLLTQVYRLSPILLTVWIVWRLSKHASQREPNSKTWWQILEPGDRQFLLISLAAPTVFALIMGFGFGMKIEAKWAVTFYMTIGSVGWLFVSGNFSTQKMIRQIVLLHLVFAAGYALIIGPIAGAVGYTTRANYPGKALSKIIYQRWQEHPELTKGESLKLVAGDSWTAGNVIIHGPNLGRETRVWVDGKDAESPWLNGVEKPLTMVVINRSAKVDYHGRHRRPDPVSSEVEALFQAGLIKGHESIPWATNEKGPHLEIDWAIVKP